MHKQFLGTNKRLSGSFSHRAQKTTLMSLEFLLYITSCCIGNDVFGCQINWRTKGFENIQPKDLSHSFRVRPLLLPSGVLVWNRRKSSISHRFCAKKLKDVDQHLSWRLGHLRLAQGKWKVLTTTRLVKVSKTDDAQGLQRSEGKYSELKKDIDACSLESQNKYTLFL